MTSFCRLLVSILLSLFECCQHVTAARGSDWDHFVFAQQWPMTTCIDADQSHEHQCLIPKNVTSWTVHGLWPTEKTSEGPLFCDSANHKSEFDPTVLDPLYANLTKFWTNLYNDTERYAFWKHEWCKHGTCAVTLDAVDCEQKYFQKGLELQQTFDLQRILSNRGIEPTNDKTFQYVEFLNALSTGLGAVPQLSCIRSAETQTQYIAQVEFCLDKSFQVIECPRPHRRYVSSDDLMSKALEFRPPTRLGYAMTMHRKKMGKPETCEETTVLPRYNSLYHESPCQSTETVAYPVIKY